MKAKIWKFDPVIYPLKLWVGVHLTQEEIENTFLLQDKESVVTEWPENFSKLSAAATTVPVWHKEGNAHLKGILVVIWDKEICNAGICAHEALHCVDWMCDEMTISGNSFEDDEAKAYLIQWVTNCIWGVLTDKPKECKGVAL